MMEGQAATVDGKQDKPEKARSATRITRTKQKVGELAGLEEGGE